MVRKWSEMVTINEWPGMTFERGRTYEAEVDSNTSYHKFPRKIPTLFVEALKLFLILTPMCACNGLERNTVGGHLVYTGTIFFLLYFANICSMRTF